jgi:hypothetical protein
VNKFTEQENEMKQNKRLMMTAALLAAVVLAAALLTIAGCETLSSLFGDSTQSATVGEWTFTLAQQTNGKYGVYLNGTRVTEFSASSKKEAQEKFKEFLAAVEEEERLANLPVTEDDFEIKQSGRYISITGYTGKPRRVVIPETISGVKVTSIEEGAFRGNRRIVSVEIPDIQSTGENTFLNCTNLESVQFHRIWNIGYAAFAGCSLTALTLPDMVETIEDYAFAARDGHKVDFDNENRIQNLVIPDSVETIGNYAFYKCGIQTLTLGKGIKTIPEGAFSKNAIASLVIPDWVTYIGRSPQRESSSGWGHPSNAMGAFEDCGIQTLTLGKGLDIIKYNTFKNNRITALTLPASIKEIQAQAFMNNQLTELVVPDSVTFLQPESFSGNPLVSIVIPPSLAPYLLYGTKGFCDAFKGVTTITSITLPANVEQSNVVQFGSDFTSFWSSQGRKAGTYVKNGRIWTLK